VYADYDKRQTAVSDVVINIDAKCRDGAERTRSESFSVSYANAAAAAARGLLLPVACMARARA